MSTLYESDALLVGVRYSVTFICSMVGGFVAGFYCARTRRTHWITVLAFVLFLAFSICMALAGRTTNTPTWGYAVILGLALGMTLTTLITIAQLSIPPQLIATASGLVISVRSLGGTIALAIYQTVSVSQINNLADNIAAAALSAGLSPSDTGDFIPAIVSKNATALAAIPSATENIINAGLVAYDNTYVMGFRYVWVTSGCFVFLAGVAAIFLRDTQNEFNMHIDAPVDDVKGMHLVHRKV